MTHDDPKLSAMRARVATVIVAVWVGSLVLRGFGVWDPDPVAGATVNGLMGILAGYLYGPAVLRRGNKDGGS